ncbi:MAG: 50S ribosomal protein L32e [Nanoarchaeota archaeon]|nr:50S ribosomal protein L32e [Nanoarchaeota archaeon]MDZ4226801.1 50S ribosomal protein L32e [Candidatus Pacearchaeota archaeon]
MKELLEIRNKAKAKKPTFLKQDAHRLSKLEQNWRQPKGMHSKMRMKLRSYRKHPSVGYSSPKEVRGLTREGYELIIIRNTKDLDDIKTPVVIGSTVGVRKRLEIIKKCEEKKIRILNLKDTIEYTKKIEDSMKERKEFLKKRTEKRKKKEEVKKETKKKEDSKNEEEIKKAKEAEKRKILEKKG